MAREVPLVVVLQQWLGKYLTSPLTGIRVFTESTTNTKCTPTYKTTLTWRLWKSVNRHSLVQIWCYFDRASSLICGNKMPTRCNRGFYCRSYCLLNMFRASPCSSGAQEYYTVVAACGIFCCGFSSSWSGVELRVMCPVCRMLQQMPQAATTV